MVSTSRFWWGILLIGLGVLFLLDTANVLNVRELVMTFWPLILVFFGMRMLIRRQMGSGQASRRVRSGTCGGARWSAGQATAGGAKGNLSTRAANWNAGGSAGSELEESSETELKSRSCLGMRMRGWFPPRFAAGKFPPSSAERKST